MSIFDGSTRPIMDICASCGSYPCRCAGIPVSLYVSSPHRCPVCEGRGLMPHGFYDRMTVATSTEQAKCRSCWGSGVIWR